jgi:hypothetical protein
MYIETYSSYLIRYLVGVSIVLCVSSAVWSQDSGWDEWRARQVTQFQNYVSEQDQAFATFLRKEWVQMGLETAEPGGEQKFLDAPEYSPNADEVPLRGRLHQDPSMLKSPQNERRDPSNVRNQMAVRTPASGVSRFTMPDQAFTGALAFRDLSVFGITYQIALPEYYQLEFTGNPSPDALADYWLYLSAGPYQPIISWISEMAEQNLWNQWLTAQFVRNYASTLFRQENSRVAFTWFILKKMGTNVRLGYYNTDLFVMVASVQPIFSVPRLHPDGTDYYYVVDGLNQRSRRAARLYTYSSDESVLELRSMDLAFEVTPRGISEHQTRNLSFVMGADTLRVALRFDRNFVDFMKDYPQAEPYLFFTLPASPAFEASVRQALMPLVQDLPVDDALNVLMRFVQTAFAYQTDTRQFNRQRFMTPDEILFYPYSDCDDRAILFSWLVRMLLGLDTAGIEYPGHMATAVRLPDVGIARAQIAYNGASWLICDPTYIFADCGMVMPQFEGVAPKFFQIP